MHYSQEAPTRTSSFYFSVNVLDSENRSSPLLSPRGPHPLVSAAKGRRERAASFSRCSIIGEVLIRSLLHPTVSLRLCGNYYGMNDRTDWQCLLRTRVVAEGLFKWRLGDSSLTW